MIEFTENDFPTVGIEQEFHLIDPETAELLPCVDNVFNELDRDMRKSTTYELYLAVLEHQSPVCRTIDELLTETINSRHSIAKACEKAGAKLVAAGSHPFSDWQKIPIVPSDHYKWVIDHCAYLARRLLSFGLHVHVGMKNVNSAMYVMYEMRRWVYPLLALSSNSPYYEGSLTGLSSTRAHLFGSMPRTHLPPYFQTFEELEDFFNKLVSAGDVTRPGDLWWMLRPQPPLGTVEIRAFDLPTDVRRLGALAAISQAALALYQDNYFHRIPPSKLNPAYLDQNHFKAMRYGLECKVIDAMTGQIVDMRGLLEKLFDEIEAKAKELQSAEHLDFARKMLSEPTESQWQKNTCEKLNGDLRELELKIAEKTTCSFLSQKDTNTIPP
ncbi:MAG: carboxylate-amine ligase [Planctomycetota bacterium]|jgi:carboxylate-amine ligase